jgi:ketosteroid isomerase-like protein
MTTRDELRAFNDRFSKAASESDLKTIVDSYDDEAAFVMAGIPTFKGRDGMTALFTEFLSSGPVRMRFESGDVWESGDLVVDVGTYVVGDGEDHGRFVTVYRRQPDGSLALLVDAPIRDEPPSD